MSADRYSKGVKAEGKAALMLRLKGYRILKTRYKTPHGEIDLIARRGKSLAFIEVKARDNKAKALEAISSKAQSRIRNAALQFISEHPEAEALNMRFDVVAVYPRSWPQHFENMWS